jgi:pimeloyl-ACP methyl ester carboxylesterase
VKADADDERITTKRDLEDFAALHLIIDPAFQGSRSPFTRSLDRWDRPLADKPLVRFDLAMAAQGTGIRLFRAATSSARDHVEDPDAVALQVTRFNTNAEDSINTPVSRGAVPTTIGDLTLYAEFDATKRSQRPEFLFEAFGQPAKTTLTFTVTVTYPQPQGSGGAPRTAARSHELSLDLRSIKDFYTRMQVPYRIGARDDRFTHFVPGMTDLLPHFGAAQPLFTGKTGDMPFLSGSDTVVLVHGWNMTDGTQTNGPPGDWKKAFAETAFKRLYWQGFRGDFTAFDWPNFADQEGRLQGDLEVFNSTYNASEYQAFRSGRSLMTFLADKKATGPVHLLAHSMGNVVAAEALRQWTAAGNGQPLVSNYVAMQGALSAGAYGDDATDATVSGIDYYRHWPTGWNGDTNRYYMQGTDRAAGKWINMFNEVDRATSAEFAWVGNNRIKPTAGDVWRDVAPGIPLPDARRFAYRVTLDGKLLRSYATPTGNPLPDGETDLAPGLTVGPKQLPGPSAYEALAFMSKASAKPIGTKSVRFFGTNINIQSLGLSDTYVDEWPGHSFQFHFDAATTSQFWKRVVDETGMNTGSNPRNP